MKVTYSPQAIADLIDVLGYLGERSPASATRLETRVHDKIDRLATREFEGAEVRLRSGILVRSWPVPPLRIYYQRLSDELFVVRVYHQTRRPIVRPTRKAGRPSRLPK